MSWITVLLATVATTLFGLLALWLIGSLAEVVHWLESVDASAPPPADAGQRTGADPVQVPVRVPVQA
ncbi:MAG: hypothetical protein H6933_01705 [Burkholderiaceae bacterium]|nr:hypothetical protein [Rhodoferax sp.]MCP5283595.1 hypothetical protein [Burkholderiaceae bacterium]